MKQLKIIFIKKITTIRDNLREKLFEQEEDYYHSVRVGNFCSNNCVEYENDGDTNKTLSTEEYLNKNRPHLNNITDDLKKSDTWKIN